MTTRRGVLAGLLASAALPALAKAMPAPGLSYVVFEDFDLSKFGPDARIPHMDLYFDKGECVGLNGFTFDGSPLDASRFPPFRLFDGDGQVSRIWADEKLIYER